MNPLARLFNNLITRGFEAFGKYYSCYRGFVVDNEDPEGYGRVKLKVPQVYGGELMDYWAWPRNCFAGKNYGMQITPQKKEMVWVEFEQGNPRKPVWSFGHFGKATDGTKEKPENLMDIQNFWFKTPGGHLIELDDKNKILRVTSNGDIKLIDGDGNSLISSNKTLQLNGNDEPAVLGDKNEDVLKALQADLKTICQTLVTIGTADATVASNLGLSYAGSLAGLATTLVDIIAIQTKITLTKSKKVKLS